MRRPARAHVVLGMDLDETDRPGSRPDLVEMTRLEPDAGRGRQRGRGEAGGDRATGRGHRRLSGREGREGGGAGAGRRPLVGPQALGTSRVSGVSEPLRSPGSIIEVQVPFGTALKTLPW
mgnify:CR=1 FL=1